MQPALDPRIEAVLRPQWEELRLFFKDLNTTVAMLDIEYKKQGIYYHRISPDVRDEVSTGGTDRHMRLFEYRADNKLPIPIELIRGLDTIIHNASLLLRRGKLAECGSLRSLKHDADRRLQSLKWDLGRLRRHSLTIETKGSDGEDAMIDARGPAIYHAMTGSHRIRFLDWAAQLREVQVGMHPGVITTLDQMIDIVLGEEERFIIELPDVEENAPDE